MKYFEKAFAFSSQIIWADRRAFSRRLSTNLNIIHVNIVADFSKRFHSWLNPNKSVSNVLTSRAGIEPLARVSADRANERARPQAVKKMTEQHGWR